MDSDGYLFGGCFEFSSKRKVLAEDVTYIARSLGLAAYMKKVRKKCYNNGKVGTYYLVSISGNTNIIPTKVKRKQAEPRKQKKDVLVTGISLRKLKADNYYGYATDGNQRFLLSDFTVVHNSPVVVALAKYFEKAHIMTPQKILQNQYTRDFSDDMFVMKGQSNYSCLKADKSCKNFKCKKKKDTVCNGANVKEFANIEAYDTDAPDGFTGSDGKYHFVHNGKEYNIDGCEYKCHLTAARLHSITLHNFHSFLYQGILTGAFSKRKLLVVDEAHNIENAILSFFNISISNKVLNDEKYPQFRDTKHIADYFHKESYSRYINNLKSSYPSLKSVAHEDSRYGYLVLLGYTATFNNDHKLLQEIDDLKLKIELFCTYSKDNDFVFEINEFKGAQSLIVKPVYIKFFMKRFFSWGEKVFLTSATILDKDVYCSNLDISKDECEFIQMPSEFPIEKRPIYVWTKGDLIRKNFDETMPKVLDQVETLVNHYKDKRGIIHTHNNAIAKMIKGRFTDKRFLYADDFKGIKKNGKFVAPRDALLEKHANSTNTVIVAPAMHEGLDLKDDLGRFQLIIKMPYPGQDIQTQYRLNYYKDWPWYNWMAALKIVQSYGRVVRSKDDYADTYILDGSFMKFVNKRNTRSLIPGWFVNAIKSVREE